MSLKRTPNIYVNHGNGTTSLVVTRLNGTVAIFTVDTPDVGLVNDRVWYANSNGYARSGCPGIYLHKLLIDAPIVDHRNGDVTDNRRENLRAATQVQNMANAKLMRNNPTGLKGVSFQRNKDGNVYAVARVNVGGTVHKRHFSLTKLGVVVATHEAAKHARGLREQLNGEFARHG